VQNDLSRGGFTTHRPPTDKAAVTARKWIESPLCRSRDRHAKLSRNRGPARPRWPWSDRALRSQCPLIWRSGQQH